MRVTTVTFTCIMPIANVVHIILSYPLLLYSFHSAVCGICTRVSMYHHISNSRDACNYQQRVCECDSGEQECHFSLIVEDLLSLASYKLERSASGQLRRRHNARSSNYNFTDQGELVPDEGTFNMENDLTSCKYIMRLSMEMTAAYR